jgi:hypothetical protein
MVEENINKIEISVDQIIMATLTFNLINIGVGVIDFLNTGIIQFKTLEKKIKLIKKGEKGNLNKNKN